MQLSWTEGMSLFKSKPGLRFYRRLFLMNWLYQFSKYDLPTSRCLLLFSIFYSLMVWNSRLYIQKWDFNNGHAMADAIVSR